MRTKKLEQYQIPKEHLVYLYITQGLTRRQIAEICHVSESLVKYYMKQYGIEARQRNSYARSDKAKMASAKENWRGYGDISLTYFNQLNHGKRRAKRDLLFTITIEYIWELYLKQGRKCALTGVPLQLATAGNVDRRSTIQTASLDRIDSNVGYIEGNVQWVHKDIQRMKMDLPEHKFKQLCRLVTQPIGVK